MNYLKLYFFIPFLAIALLGGCGKKEEGHSTGETTTDQTQQQTSENQPQPQGEKDPTNELGITQGLPTTYPQDLPQPLNSKAMGYLTTSEGTVVTFESDETPKAIVDQFGADLEKNGFKKDDGEMMSDDGGMVMWKKDNREASLMIARNKETNKTSAVVTYK